MYFTTSWDDGHPLDLRLVELLARRGFPATLYVPLSNREALPVMSAAQMRELDGHAEFGSHTRDHAYATTMPAGEWKAQVEQGKRGLEDALGHEVEGFCYPGGKMTAQSRQTVVDTGFAYARTTLNFCQAPHEDAFLMPTSLQFYLHPRSVLARNYLARGQWVSRWPVWRAAMGARGDLLGRLRACLRTAIEHDGVFHLWGHSWEIEAIDGWKVLAEFLAFADDHVPAKARVSNGQLARRLGRFARPL